MCRRLCRRQTELRDGFTSRLCEIVEPHLAQATDVQRMQVSSGPGASCAGARASEARRIGVSWECRATEVWPFVSLGCWASKAFRLREPAEVLEPSPGSNPSHGARPRRCKTVAQVPFCRHLVAAAMRSRMRMPTSRCQCPQVGQVRALPFLLAGVAGYAVGASDVSHLQTRRSPCCSCYLV